jgi:phosphatidylglycerophosphatase A
MNSLLRFIASGFGSGYLPKAPGTWGSLVGLVIGAALLLAFGYLGVLAGLVVATAGGLYVVRQLPERGEDPSWVVIDEIAGQMIPLLGLAHFGAFGLMLAFAAFRFFDIAKPGPVAWADARKDEIGIMGDDLIAGALALVFILLVRLVLPL